jgi:hypothetical protein
MRIGGWWRLFIVATVAWGLFTVVAMDGLRRDQTYSIKNVRIGAVTEACYVEPVVQADCEKARAERDSPVDIGSGWEWFGTWVLFFSVPPLVLLGLVWVGRWVARGFRRSA